MITNTGTDQTGVISYSQFRGMVQGKHSEQQKSNDDELLDAFVAMGGQPNGDGFIDADKLIKTIKNDFEMTIDIENLIL